MRQTLADKCLFLDGPDVLKNYGFDPDRPIAGGLFGQRDAAGSDDPGVIAVLPVFNRKAFAKLLVSADSRGLRVKLGAADDGKKPVAYEIKRLGGPEGAGRFCRRVADGSIAGVAVTVPESGSGDLRYFPDPFQNGTFGLSCRAKFDDGSVGDCKCQLGDLGDCTKLVPVDGYGEVAEQVVLIDREIAGRMMATIENEENSLYIAFPDETTAIYSNKRDLLVTSLRNPEDNLARHINSAKLRHAIEHREKHYLEDSEVLIGSLRQPSFLGLGAVAFTLQADRERLELRALPELRDPDTTFVERLIAPADYALRAIQVPPASKAALTATDRHASYFLKFILTYVDDARAGLTRVIGNFDVVVDELLKETAFTSVGFHIVDAREGFPVAVLAVALDDETLAQSLVSRLQRELRVARDTAILKAATAHYRDLSGGLPQAIETLLVARPNFLFVETSPTWEHYAIEDGRVVLRTELPDSLFEEEVYRTAVDQRRVDYILPKITDNDLAYRFQDTDYSDKDKADLKDDQNRLSGHYDKESGILWFGTDAEALRVSLGLPDGGPGESPLNAVGLAKNHGAGKVVLRLQPGWLVAQGRSHPDTERKIKDFTRKYLEDLARYEVLELTLTSTGDEDGFSAIVRFVR